MNGTSTRRVVVEPGGAGVVAHVGLHALGAFADRLGLGDALSARIPWTGERAPLHDRGKVLVQTSLMLAGGGESCADIEHLRLQEDLFGWVPSDTTVFRTFHEISPQTRSGIALALAEVRARGLAPQQCHARGMTRCSWTSTPPWSTSTPSTRCRLPPPSRAAMASTPCSASPMPPARRSHRCCVRATPGPTPWPIMWWSSTTPSSSCPPRSRSVTDSGDDPSLVQRDVIVRADSAGCTEGFLAACRERNIGFFVTVRSNAQLTGAIFAAAGMEEVWTPGCHPRRRAA